MGLIHEVMKRKKALAIKNTPPPPPTNSTEDTNEAMSEAIMERCDALNLNQTLLPQAEREDKLD